MGSHSTLVCCFSVSFNVWKLEGGSPPSWYPELSLWRGSVSSPKLCAPFSEPLGLGARGHSLCASSVTGPAPPNHVLCLFGPMLGDSRGQSVIYRLFFICVCFAILLLLFKNFPLPHLP